MRGPAPFVVGSGLTAEQVLSAIGDAVVVTDAEGRILSWNDAAETMFGQRSADVVGHPITEVVAGASSDDDPRSVLEVVRAGEVYSREVESTRVDGRTATVLVTVRPVLDDRASVLGHVGVARDTTHQRASILELDARASAHQALLSGAGDIFGIAEADGSIRSLEGPVFELLGFEPQQLVGLNLFDLVQPDDVGRARTTWAERILTDEAMPAEDYWMSRADGTWVCLSLIGNNLLDDPALRGIAVTARDVTCRVLSEMATAVARNVTAALVQAASRQEMLDAVCRVIVEGAGYELAWIGTPSRGGSGALTLEASARRDACPLPGLEQLLGCEGSPAATAVRDRQTVTVGDLRSADSWDAWGSAEFENGCRSVIALPLELDSEYAVLVICSTKDRSFTDEAVASLEQLATDVAQGCLRLRTQVEREHYRQRLEGAFASLVGALAAAAELRDPYTAGHQRRVAELASAIARRLGLPTDEVTGIEIAASLHDIGKLAVPAEILTKPTRLSDPEMAIIQEHPAAGAEILRRVSLPWPVQDMIRQHHERLDGSGYPDGLAADEILLGSRILAVADVYEAMQSHRPYRPSRGDGPAREELRRSSGVAYDAAVVEVCFEVLDSGFRFEG